MRRGTTETTLDFVLSVEGELLRASVAGRFDIEAATKLTKAIAEIVARTGVRRVLCDNRRSVVAVDALSASKYLNQLADNETLGSLRVAVLVGVRLNNLVYIEDLATRNGLQLRVFTDGALAEQWLDKSAAQLAAS